MARDCVKNTSNYIDIGINKISPLLNGASVICVSAKINYDTMTTAANDNRVVSILLADGVTGMTLMIDKPGENAVCRVGARSQSADSFQTKNGTTSLSANVWYTLGGRLDIASDLLATFTDGNKENEGTVTFGAATYTNSVPVNSGDGIGNSGTVPVATGNMFDGRIAEIAIWAGDIGDNGFLSHAKGVSPAQIRPDLLVAYWPLWGKSSPEPELKNGKNASIVGTVAASDHAPVGRYAPMPISWPLYSSPVAANTKRSFVPAVIA